MSYGFRTKRTSPDKAHRYSGSTLHRTKYADGAKSEEIPVRTVWKGNQHRMTGEIGIRVNPEVQASYMSYRNLFVELNGNREFVAKPWVLPIEKVNSVWTIGEPHRLIYRGETEKPELTPKEALQFEQILAELHRRLPEITTNHPGKHHDNKRRRATTRNLGTLLENFSHAYIAQIDKIFYFAHQTQLVVPVHVNHQNP